MIYAYQVALFCAFVLAMSLLVAALFQFLPIPVGWKFAISASAIVALALILRSRRTP